MVKGPGTSRRLLLEGVRPSPATTWITILLFTRGPLRFFPMANDWATSLEERRDSGSRLHSSEQKRVEGGRRGLDGAIERNAAEYCDGKSDVRYREADKMEIP